MEKEGSKKNKMHRKKSDQKKGKIIQWIFSQPSLQLRSKGQGEFFLHFFI
jgi:hypothetical protein